MRLYLKGIIAILLAVFILSGLSLGTNVYETYFTSNPASSTVLVENGVSGVVTITDPYLNRTSDMNIDFYPVGIGSGVIVSKDGYVITAFHVIGNPGSLQNQNQLQIMGDEDVKQYLAQIALMDYIKNENPQLINLIRYNGMIIDIEDLSYNNELITGLIAQSNLVTVKSHKHVVRIKTPSNNIIFNSKTYNARIVDVGDPRLFEDVALLKMDNVQDMPPLAVSSQRPISGEEVTIYGYPGYTGSQYRDSIKPTSSEGILTSKLYNNFGIVYYQTNAKTAQGISGGPAVDDQNKVLGILVYGVQKQNRFRQSITSDYSLFLSSDYIIDILERNGVQFKT